ncbi:MAG TPA: GMP/IMP nucleotidase [Gammaproteobacteria bacterium]|nr:GMP/IMP nucleotidase [Gammaproteobacteria bacterium]
MNDSARATIVPEPLVEWDRVDTVLLDMDGTLLDLEFDNRFWVELLPRHWGAQRGLDYEQALAELYPLFKAREGTLAWYSVAFWQETLGVDIVGLKHELADLVRPAPHAEEFLASVRATGRRMVLVTNAHSDTLEFKLARIEIGQYFDAMYTSHAFGMPKEADGFWDRLREVEPFAPARALFVDDSENVLNAARDYGIGQVVQMLQPDSTRPPRPAGSFPAALSLKELMPA